MDNASLLSAFFTQTKIAPVEGLILGSRKGDKGRGIVFNQLAVFFLEFRDPTRDVHPIL